MCVDQLDLARDSINQISLYKLTPSISIYSTIYYIKTRLNERNLKPDDLSLLNSKFANLEGWLFSFETIHVDIKAHYDDIKQLLQSCQHNVNRAWVELQVG